MQQQPMHLDRGALRRAAARLHRARSVLVLTGAGISAESGIPTFREAQTGLWERFDPSELATPEAFERDPELVWRWYAWRRSLVISAQPNAGHFALAELESVPERFAVVTQNVDGLHQKAGSRNVVEYHGNLMRTICSRDGAELAFVDPADPSLPRCPTCGSPGRPAVVWFGELIPAEALEVASQAASDCDVLLSVGTSSLVYPAAGVAETALRSGAFVIEVNPGRTPLTGMADAALSAPAGVALPALLAALRETA